MRSIFVPAVVLGMAFAGSAMAQSSSTPNSSSSMQANPPQANQGSQQGTQQPSALNEAQLKQDLQKAGFKDIRVLDAAYLVRATTKDGNTIVMMINPPDVTAVENLKTGSTGSNPNAATSGSTSNMSATPPVSTHK